MKLWIALLLIGLTAAFTVNTVNDFPSQMYGGGEYHADYQIDGDAIYPFFSFVNISNAATDEITVKNCTLQTDGQWLCNATKKDFNITINLVSNLKPDNYNISVYFSGNYTVSDPALVVRSYSSSGGGSGPIYGYVTKNKTKEEILKNASDAIIEGEKLLNKTKPVENASENYSEEPTVWVPSTWNYSFEFQPNNKIEQNLTMPYASASMSDADFIKEEDLKIMYFVCLVVIAIVSSALIWKRFKEGEKAME